MDNLELIFRMSCMTLLGLCLAACDGNESRDDITPKKDQAVNESGSERKRPIALWLGDSLTDAANVDADKRFAALVAAERTEYEHIIQGRGGWSAASYLRNWDEKVAGKLPEQADLVIIQLGANDLREHGVNQAGIDRYLDDMATLVGKLRKRYPQANFLALAPANFTMGQVTPGLRESGFGDATNHWLEQAGLQLKPVSRELGMDYISLYGTLADGHTTDGAHPTEAGHLSIAKRILEGWPE